MRSNVLKVRIAKSLPVFGNRSEGPDSALCNERRYRPKLGTDQSFI